MMQRAYPIACLLAILALMCGCSSLPDLPALPDWWPAETSTNSLPVPSAPDPAPGDTVTPPTATNAPAGQEEPEMQAPVGAWIIYVPLCPKCGKGHYPTATDKPYSMHGGTNYVVQAFVDQKMKWCAFCHGKQNQP